MKRISFGRGKSNPNHDLKTRKNDWQSTTVLVILSIVASLALSLTACIFLDWPVLRAGTSTAPVPKAEISTVSDQPPRPDGTVLVWGSVCDGAGCTPAGLLFGKIPDDPQEVTAELQNRPDVKKLCLRSPGGNSKGGVALASWLFENDYNTCIPRIEADQAVCASACTYVFAAGKQRNADRQASFGIHGSAHPALIQYPADTISGESGRPKGQCAFCKALSVALNAGVSVIGHALTWAGAPSSELMRKLLLESVFIPAHTIRLLSPAEMVNWNVTTTPVDGVLEWRTESR